MRPWALGRCVCVCVCEGVRERAREEAEQKKNRFKEAEGWEFCVQSQDTYMEQLQSVRQQCPSEPLFSFPRSHCGGRGSAPEGASPAPRTKRDTEKTKTDQSFIFSQLDDPF